MRSSVALIDIGVDPGLQTIAPACLREWALRDAELARACRFATLYPTVADEDEAIAGLIARESPEVVGFSTYVWNIEKSLRVARLVKAALPGARVVLGGPYAGPLWKQMLEKPDVDFVATGEGEETLRLLLRSLILGEGSAAAVPGLASRGEEGPVSTEPAALIEGRLLSFPLSDDEMSSKPRVIMETSRGCPFTCKFCDWGERQMRYLPLERLEADFRMLAGKFPHIILTDADLLMNKRIGHAVMESYLRGAAGTSSVLTFQSNPTFLTREAAEIMGRAPDRFSPQWGVQTTTPSVLKRIDRDFDQRRVEANLGYLRKFPGILSVVELIFGLPGDTREGFTASVDWAFRQEPWAINMYYPYALPGADFFKQAKELGIRYDPRPPHAVLSTEFLGEEDMAELSEFALYAQLLLMLGEVRPLLVERLNGGARPESFSAFVDAWRKAVKRGQLLPEQPLIPAAEGSAGPRYAGRLDTAMELAERDRSLKGALCLLVHQVLADDSWRGAVLTAAARLK